MVDIEMLKRMTGWDEAKLAAFITERANEGMSEDQIINAIGQQKSMDMGLDKISKPVVSDNTYVMPTVSEMMADGSIKKETKKKEPSTWQKFSTWIKENANADEERNARARQAIADSWNDYRDRTDPMFRVGLVNAIFGDNSMLNGYYNNVNSAKQAALQRMFQAEENEKNREATAEENEKNRQVQIAMNNKMNSEDTLAKAKERQRQLAAVELGDELRDKVENGELTREEAKAVAHKAYREGALTYEELKDTRNRIDGKTKTETEQEKAEAKADARSDKFQGAADARVIKKADEAADEADEKKKLANSGRKKLAMDPPRKPTRKEQEAIDAGY